MGRRATKAPLICEAVPDLSWIRPGFPGLRREISAGLVGAVLVIPQAITFAFLAGLPPEYGIYCAIWVTLFACLFGNSTIVGGPNTAVAILIGAAVLPFAGRGSPLYIDCVLLLSFSVGLVQLTVWASRLGFIFRYFSPSAITGITTGVGILIVFSSLDGLLGVDTLTPLFFYEKLFVLITAADDLINPYAAGIGLLTVAAGMAARRRRNRYFILIAIGAGLAAGLLVGAVFPQVETELELLGRLPFSVLPFSVPQLGWDYLVIGMEMIPDAIAIAFIGLAQTLVIAKQLNLETAQQVNINRETYAQGMANLLSAFFSSFAGSGSFNRTAVGQEMGASTPLAGIVSSVGVLIIALMFGEVFAFMPLPVMAGVLFIVGWTMIKPREIRRLTIERREAAIFGLTFLTVILIGLQPAILLAMVLSFISFLTYAAKLEMRIFNVGPGRSLEIYGNLFYASVDQFAASLRELEGEPLILNLRHVSYMDHGAAEIILREEKRRRATGERFVVFVQSSQHQILLDRIDTEQDLNIVCSHQAAKAALS